MSLDWPRKFPGLYEKDDRERFLIVFFVVTLATVSTAGSGCS